MIVIGIDCGFLGALAVLEYSPELNITNFLEVVDAPVFWRKKKRYLNSNTMAGMLEAALDGIEGRHLVVIEKVGARPMQDVSSVLRYGYGAGMWQGATGHFRDSCDVWFVEPNAWKKGMGVTADKETSLAKARELMPEAVPRITRSKDDGRAEAILIALFAIREMRSGRKCLDVNRADGSGI